MRNRAIWFVAAALGAAGIGAGGCKSDNGTPVQDSGAVVADSGVTGDGGGKVDTAAAPTSLTVVTYNTGLAHGAVAAAPARQPQIVAALKEVKADLICLQEVWKDDDAQALTDGLKTQYPFSFREKTEDTSTAQVRCGDLGAVLALKTCVDTDCTPKGISASQCVESTCKTPYDKLDDGCKRCLAANTDNPTSCAIGGAKEFTYGGRNGLLLLSRTALKDAKYTPLDAILIKRGVITATVAERTIQCTHLSADLGVVPYPKDRPYKTWLEELAGEIQTLSKTAGMGCTILLGDLNCGPAKNGLTGEGEDTFNALDTAGYHNLWRTPVCTWCKDNPLGGGADKLIDHVLFKTCPAGDAVTYTRILDQEITVQESGQPLKTRLSDHYGVKAEIKLAK